MNINDIFESENPEADLLELLSSLHKFGPVNSEVLEHIGYFKKFHNDLFQSYEEEFISALGLFYKIPNPESLYSFLLSHFDKQYLSEFKSHLTPVQASIRRAIDNHQVISISAPTSAGKSFSIRDFISESDQNTVIVVPSRALIAEYVNSMRHKFQGDKSVMISSFVDEVFSSRAPKRIFILTPERARDLFKSNIDIDIGIFFFDEAQVSEEKKRGIIFDVLVRRIKKVYPSATLIFAHPFVENPEAQINKHDFSNTENYSHSYPHGAVGKLCVFKHDNSNDYYFSPFIDKCHKLENCRKFDGKFESFAFDGNHTVLVYVSKASIYNGNFIKSFERYINKFESIKDDNALRVIDTIEHLLGADKSDHNSELVRLLKKGVVIHHGSVPLEVRFLIEKLIRDGFSNVCFATSTLAQGVNMPFDIVWLDNMRSLGEDAQTKALSFKNLIGRAGRLTKEPKFDFGYIYTKNPKLFSERINEKFTLKNESILEQDIESFELQDIELIESMKAETFDEDKQAPLTKIARLGHSDILTCCRHIVDVLYQDGTIKQNLRGEQNKEVRSELLKCFKLIYETALDRSLEAGESAVFDQAISILLRVMQGTTFREIVGIRYSYITRKDAGSRGEPMFSQPAHSLPDSNLKKSFSLFDRGAEANKVSYDAVVFDTYDYLDQVISFSLTDTFITAFQVYEDVTADRRAGKMMELLRYGTNDQVHVMLLRYGFAGEDIADIATYVRSIDEHQITFEPTIYEAPDYILSMVEWYLP